MEFYIFKCDNMVKEASIVQSKQVLCKVSFKDQVV